MAQLIRKGEMIAAVMTTASPIGRRICRPRVASSQITAGASNAMVVILVRQAPPPSAPAMTALVLVGTRAKRVHAHVLDTAKNANSSSRQPPMDQYTAR